MARIKNGAIEATMTLPGVARRRGRPATGKAKTAAQRMREYRQRRQDQSNEFPSRVTKMYVTDDEFSVRGEYEFPSRVTENEGSK
jgi:hypothetical protein